MRLDEQSSVMRIQDTSPRGVVSLVPVFTLESTTRWTLKIDQIRPHGYLNGPSQTLSEPIRQSIIHSSRMIYLRKRNSYCVRTKIKILTRWDNLTSFFPGTWPGWKFRMHFRRCRENEKKDPCVLQFKGKLFYCTELYCIESFIEFACKALKCNDCCVLRERCVNPLPKLLSSFHSQNWNENSLQQFFFQVRPQFSSFPFLSLFH